MRSPVHVALGFALAACGSDESVSERGGGAGDASADAPSAELEWPNLECDPIVPTYCAFPFPSNVFTRRDATSATGRRVSILPGAVPMHSNGTRGDPAPFNGRDGFSPGAELLFHFPGASEAGVPTPATIPRSLEPDSPTVVMRADTGERVPHFAEIDRTSMDPERRAFAIRPVVRLEDSTRYIVAVRSLTYATGEEIPASPAFIALRDGRPLDSEPSVEVRRALYERIFSELGDAGVDRDNLQVAWDFTTSSREDTTGRLVHMRDEALAASGESGPAFRIDSVDDSWNTELVAHRIEGTMTAPLYLDQPGPGGHLQFGDDGMPEPSASSPTMEVPFLIIIPKSAATKPAAIVQYGHGLFGSKDQIEADHFLTFMNEFGYVFVGVDMIGMAGDDPGFIAGLILNGTIADLEAMFDRMHQGMLNQLLCTRMVIRGLAEDPTYGPLLDPTRVYYHGISQGGILGGVYLALSTDVERGALGVMGQPYNLLLPRSVDFDPFFLAFRVGYSDPLDVRFLLGAVQMLWDRVDPNGYTPYLAAGTPLGAPPHQALLRAAVGDHQVPTLGAHVMARTIGAKHVDTGLRDVFALDKVERTTTGSGYVEYDFGVPEHSCNVPVRACSDPHGKVRSLDAARTQLDRFLRTGAIENDCAGGVCFYPELSGCDGTETDPCEAL